ncbi:hypothetical protein AALI21_09170 [Corynebacteriaceae bacterium 6-324]
MPELVVAAIGTLIARASLFIHDSGIIALALMFILISICSLPFAVPLAYTKVGTYWIDIVYVAVGVFLVRYMESFPDEGAIFFLGLLYPLDWAFIFSGCSHLLRRTLAIYRYRRKHRRSTQ